MQIFNPQNAQPLSLNHSIRAARTIKQWTFALGNLAAFDVPLICATSTHRLLDLRLMLAKSIYSWHDFRTLKFVDADQHKMFGIDLTNMLVTCLVYAKQLLPYYGPIVGSLSLYSFIYERTLCEDLETL